MPLFMDYHVFTEVTIDEVKKAHMADLEVQEKYDVKYHQFWVNEEAGTVFCLIEGPNKEACEATHREAHGDIACNIVEVEPGFYELVMGQQQNVDKNGIVRNIDGSIDQGYRYLLVVDIRGNTSAKSSIDYRELILPTKAKNLAKSIIHSHEGHVLNTERDDIIGVFKDSHRALHCAIQIKDELLKRSTNPENAEWDTHFKMGLCGSQPLTEEEGLIENALRIGQRLSLAADNYEILVANLIKKMSDTDEILDSDESVRFISVSEEKFLNTLLDIVEKNISDRNFSVKSLSKNIGVSRPQLYRKTTSVAGRSPNRLIRDIRMKRALELLKEKQYNISEISMKVGYYNPSYFSKCFQEQYGISPSKIAT